MKKNEIITLITAVVLLLPCIGIVCNNAYIAILTVVYMAAMFSFSRRFWAKVYEVSVKLENLIFKQ